MKKKKLTFLILIILLLGLLSFSYLFFIKKQDFLSPLSSEKSFLKITESKKQVIGFLPFWTIKEEENFHYDLLDQIIYMGIEFDKEGQIVKKIDSYLEPGWSNFQSDRFESLIKKAKKKDTKIILGIQNYTNETIEEIIQNPIKRKRVISQTISLLDEKNLDGVNIDFEYGGTNLPLLAADFTSFVEEFDSALEKKNPQLLLSVDVFADSIRRSRIYEIEKLTSLVDQIIIMGYDFHRAGSVSAGPVAPLRSNSPYSILSILDDFFKASEREKLVLAVPYYGYEWPTLNENFGSPVYEGGGALATYKRTVALIEDKNLKTNWDQTSMTPWLVYKDRGNIKQIYFENERSLSLKYSLVKQADLGGIAIWALGYDGERKELWDLLEKSF